MGIVVKVPTTLILYLIKIYYIYIFIVIYYINYFNYSIMFQNLIYTQFREILKINIQIIFNMSYFIINDIFHQNN